MLIPLLDFVEGAEPTSSDNIFMLIVTLFMLIPYIYLFFLYILQALGLHRIAKRRGIHHPWLAWVPFGNTWLLGSIADHYQFVTRRKTRYCRVLLLILSVFTWLAILFVLIFTWEAPLFIMNIVYGDALQAFLHTPLVANNLLPVTTGLVIILFGLRLFPLYRLYQSSLPRYRLPLLILNIVVPFSPSVTIFAVRNYDNGMPPRCSPNTESFSTLLR